MKISHKGKDLYLCSINIDGKFVIATYDPNMKTKLFKLNCEEIEDQTSLLRFKAQKSHNF